MHASANRPSAESVWTGRIDGDTPEFARWHQVVRPTEADRPVNTGSARPSVAVVGFASDEGVRRNHGRPGAAEGPTALRRALAPLAVHCDVAIVDAGDIEVDGTDLEAGQQQLGFAVAELLDSGHLVIVLGGGHESAYGSGVGRANSTRLAGKRAGILNLDAHFDLRQSAQASSGTPFAQIARDDLEADREFVYAVIGICRDANTASLFSVAADLHARYLLDVDCQPGKRLAVLDFVDEFLADVEIVHLSIDLDVLPASVAPGVSAPAGFGVPMEVLIAVCDRVAASGKLVVVDVVELNPPHDTDGRTARSAARLISTLTHGYCRDPRADQHENR